MPELESYNDRDYAPLTAADVMCLDMHILNARDGRELEHQTRFIADMVQRHREEAIASVSRDNPDHPIVAQIVSRREKPTICKVWHKGIPIFFGQRLDIISMPLVEEL